MGDTKQLVALLGTKFIQRRDVKAFQRDDGAWFPERTPLTMADFQAHLDGTKTLGHYMLDPDGNTKLFAFDIDLVKHARSCSEATCKGCAVTFPGFKMNDHGDVIEIGEFTGLPREMYARDNPAFDTLTMDLRIIAEGLALSINALNIPVAVATSGHKGLHVYGFTGTMPAETARAIAVSILEEMVVFEAFRGSNFWRHKFDYDVLDIELFPKQGSLAGKDLGNLMSLPLGKHRVTGRRKTFLSLKSRLDRFVPMEPELALDGDSPWE